MTRTHQVQILLAFIAIYFIWGTTYLAIRVVVHSIPPYLSMAIRFLVSGVVFYLWLRFRGVERPTWRHWRTATFVGSMLLCVGVGGVSWAEQYISSGIAALLIALMPLWYALFDWLLKNTAFPKPIVWSGMACGFMGVSFLIFFQEGSKFEALPLVPVLMILFGSICWALGSIYNKNSEKHPHSLMDTTLQMIAGGSVNLIVALGRGEWADFHPEQVETSGLWAMVYLIVMGSFIAFPAFSFLIQNVNASLVSTYSYVNPVIAVFLGWLILDEFIGKNIIIASLFILVGIALIKIGDVPGVIFWKKRVPAP